MGVKKKPSPHAWHLKECFDVNVYGDLENLHSNLRNVLTNLCHRVEMHKEFTKLAKRA